MLVEDQTFDAQEWPFAPGPRRVRMHVAEPPRGVGPNTGLLLVLHNWGGTYNEPHYLASCRTFADRYDVVAISVNYLQSGPAGHLERGDVPYDHGYLQAMDCLRALAQVRRQLHAAGRAFQERRIFSLGGSGGGNVTQMACKLAPHTFACGVDLCGMPGLTDGIAYGTGEFGSQLNAGYSRDPARPNHLARDHQRIRDFGDLGHARLLHAANPDLKLVIVHGVDDRSCPVVHKIRQFANLVEAGIDVDGHFLTPRDVDGVAVTSTGHAIGNRDQVVMKYADDYLLPAGRLARARSTPNDFERGGAFAYPGDDGQFVVDFAGDPTIRYEPAGS